MNSRKQFGSTRNFSQSQCDRRSFLRGLGQAAMAMGVGSAGALSFANQAAAATVGDYKALVCVFLYGGLDTHDVLIPNDVAGYEQWAAIRQELLTTQGQARARSSLLPINPGATATLNGSLGFAPEWSGLHGLYQSGRLAVAANVGPLIQPATRSDFINESVPFPPRLFSHNDQQSVWQASAPEGAQFGWGGLFADAVINSGANQQAEFTTITSLGNELFLTGQLARPFQVNDEGAAQFDLIFDDDVRPDSLVTLLNQHFASVTADTSNLLVSDMASASAGALSSNAAYNSATAGVAALSTPFPASPLGAQLKAVAQAISARDQLQAQRQIFFVGIGGFDTHSAQATSLPQLLTQIDGAVTAFYNAMVAQGLGNKVTLFTASDFGRTLAVNGDGTDHGWGSHQIVVGDAVNGGLVHGYVPPSVLEHDYDAGGGRLIPTLSVEQYAAPLGRWFGLDNSEVLAALPNRANFLDEPMLML